MRGQGHRRHRGAAIELGATTRPRVGRRWWLLTVLLLTATIAGACDESEEERLTVFAAASLRDVMAELEAAWLAEHPDVPLTVATDASNVLAAQIVEGAAADVFLSADTRRPLELAEAGHSAGTPRSFAVNRVTVVVSLEGGLRTPLELASPGVRLVGTGRGVPVTGYAESALGQLADTTADPSAFRESVRGNIVSREDNVRAALAKVELGEGDAAVVYRTDALGSERVREVPFPDGVDVTAEYAAVAITPRDRAQEFVAWLATPAARAVLQAAGFEGALP